MRHKLVQIIYSVAFPFVDSASFVCDNVRVNNIWLYDVVIEKTVKRIRFKMIFVGSARFNSVDFAEL